MALVGSAVTSTSAASSASQKKKEAGQSGQTQPVVDFGYSRSINQSYHLKTEVLGTGGNAIVQKAVSVKTGIEYACKSIPKVLDPSKFSPQKCDTHANAIAREVEVLQRLRGCLNVVELHDVFEDEVRRLATQSVFNIIAFLLNTGT